MYAQSFGTRPRRGREHAPKLMRPSSARVPTRGHVDPHRRGYESIEDEWELCKAKLLQAVFGGQSRPCGFKNVKGRLESVRPQNTFFVHPKGIDSCPLHGGWPPCAVFRVSRTPEPTPGPQPVAAILEALLTPRSRAQLDKARNPPPRRAQPPVSLKQIRSMAQGPGAAHMQGMDPAQNLLRRKRLPALRRQQRLRHLPEAARQRLCPDGKNFVGW